MSTLLSLTTSTNQSPKIRQNQIRPGSSIGITKKTEKKGVNHPEAYKSIPFNKTYCQFHTTSQGREGKNEISQKINNNYMNTQKEKYMSMLNQARIHGVEVKNMYNHIRQSGKNGSNPICLLVHSINKDKHRKDDTNIHSSHSTKPTQNQTTPIIKIKKTFNSNTKSNSEWEMTTKKKSMSNHSSIEYNPIMPSRPNSSYTRQGLQVEFGENCFGRQKQLGEFIELTRIDCQNGLKLYEDYMNNNKNGFMKSKEICVRFNDLYGKYGSLVDKPFSRKE